MTAEKNEVKTYMLHLCFKGLLSHTGSYRAVEMLLLSKARVAQ